MRAFPGGSQSRALTHIVLCIALLILSSGVLINPELERWYAKRANSHTIEVPGASHAMYVSHPKEVAAAIEDAAVHAN